MKVYRNVFGKCGSTDQAGKWEFGSTGWVRTANACMQSVRARWKGGKIAKTIEREGLRYGRKEDMESDPESCPWIGKVTRKDRREAHKGDQALRKRWRES